MSFSVKLRTDEFQKRRLVAGPIWLEIDSQAFPIDGWSDFPVVILGWWLNNLKPMIANRAARCECPFMDGPYKFEVTVRNKSGWIVTFIKDGVDGEVRLAEKELDSKAIISEVLLSARTVINLCQEKEWRSEDLAILAKEAEEVENLIRRFL